MESPLLRKNLLEKVSAPEPRRVSTKVWKEVGIDVLTVCAALWTSFAYRAYLAETGTLTIFFVAVSLFAILALLGAVFSRNFMHRTILALVVSFALVVFFEGQLSVLMAAASIMFLVILAGEMAARKEVENGLRIKFFSIAKVYLKKLATAVVLLIVIFLPKFDPATQEPLFSDRLFEGIFNSSITIAGGLYPEVRFGDSLLDFIESDITLKVSSDPQFQEMTPTQQKLLIGDAVRRQLAEFEKTLGKAIDPAQPLKNFIFDFVQKTIGDFAAQAKQWIVIAWVVILFLAFRGIGIVFYWGIACIAFMIYHSLVAFEFAKIHYEPREHESVELT